MPVISNEDYAAFQAWKAQGGGTAPQVPAQQPPTPTVTPPPTAPSPTLTPPALKTWDPQKGWQGGPGADPNGPLPPPRDLGGGQFDYTDQNAEISRRAMAAKNDPNSPSYVSPEQQAQRQQANALYAAANPGWTFSESEGAWRWTGQGQPVTQKTWAELARDNPRVFGIEGQGLYGEGSDNFVKDPATGAMRQKTPAEWEAGKAPVSTMGPQNYGGTDPNAPPAGWVRGPDGQLRPASVSSTPAPAAAPAGPSAAGIGREGAPRPAAPPPAGVVGGGHRPIVRSPSPPPAPAPLVDPQDVSRLDGALDDKTINPPPKPTMPGGFRPPRVRFPGAF